MLRRIFIIFGLVSLLQGCANPFAQFYYDQTRGLDLTKMSNVVLPTGEPRVYRGNDQEQDALKMAEDNYYMVGYSSFNGANVNDNGAIIQAKKVHASVVILYSKYTGSVSGSIPLTLPDTQTSSTSMSGKVTGTGGYASYSGTASTTTYGSKTTYIPYTVHRSDYLATYWIKGKPPILGVQVIDLTQEIRSKIQSNKGVLITTVVKGSPAFRSDILKGDVLRKVGDTEIYDVESFMNAMPQYAGQKVIMILYRNGEILQKEIQLNEQR